MPAAPKWIPAAPALVEQPDSGAIDYEDEASITRNYRGKYDDAVSNSLSKGTLGSGDTSGLVVKKCSVRKERGEVGLLTIVWVGFPGPGGSEDAQLPADTFDLQPVELNPAVETHPNFDAVTGTYLATVREAGLMANEEISEKAYDKVVAFATPPNPEALHLAVLLRRGVTSYYLPAFRYSWTTYSITEPTVTRGGYVQAPGGPLSTLIAGLTLSCLREADSLSGEGGIYALTMTWVCAPLSHWSSAIYETV